MNLEQLQGFERLHREFARQLADRVSSLVGRGQPVQADLAFTDRTSYGEFILSLSTHNYSFRYAVEGLGDVVLAVPIPLADGLVVPGKGEPAAQVQNLGEGMARDLEAIWSPLTPFTITQIEPHSDPWAIGAAPMYAVTALQAVEVKAAGSKDELSGLVEVCYPASVIRDVLDRLPAVP